MRSGDFTQDLPSVGNFQADSIFWGSRGIVYAYIDIYNT